MLKKGEQRSALPDESGTILPMNRLPGFHVMVKPTGPVCNLDCKYCFYLEKENLYPQNSNWPRRDDVLENFFRQYIEGQQARVISFAWHGGEPTLLGVGFFRKIVDLQKKYATEKQVENAFQTNGILLDDKWCEFLAENNFLIGISINDPRKLHDCYRVDKGGRPTFDRVLRGLEHLKKHGVEFNTLTVVHRKNSYSPLEVYRFLNEIGSGFMQFIPVVERIAPVPDSHGLVLIGTGYAGKAQVSQWSVEVQQFGTFLSSIINEWVRQDVGRYFVQTFDVALESRLGLDQSLCVFRKTCGTTFAIDHNGDIYSCDHYVYPENKLGNITERPFESMVHSLRQLQFGLAKQESLPRYCRECTVRFACNGECPKHRFIRTPDGEEGLNYLCAGYKTFFQHIDPYMRFMAEELRHKRPPANVMEWAKLRDSQTATRKSVGRNSACPCGSGRKFKKCCGRGDGPARFTGGLS